jgi:catechol 2,3-dioxygenase-like lactoylglutathione lyase family enzyme
VKVNRFATGLPAEDAAATTRFYVEHFGFSKKMDIGWFTSQGLLGFVVEDAAAEEQRLRDAGVVIVKPITDEVYGQRHFYCADPDGTLIDVIEMIPPDPEWTEEVGLG